LVRERHKHEAEEFHKNCHGTLQSTSMRSCMTLESLNPQSTGNLAVSNHANDTMFLGK